MALLTNNLWSPLCDVMTPVSTLPLWQLLSGTRQNSFKLMRHILILSLLFSLTSPVALLFQQSARFYFVCQFLHFISRSYATQYNRRRRRHRVASSGRRVAPPRPVSRGWQEQIRCRCGVGLSSAREDDQDDVSSPWQVNDRMLGRLGNVERCVLEFTEWAEYNRPLA